MIEILNEIANSTTLFIVGAWFGLVITIVLGSVHIRASTIRAK